MSSVFTSVALLITNRAAHTLEEEEEDCPQIFACACALEQTLALLVEGNPLINVHAKKFEGR